MDIRSLRNGAAEAAGFSSHNASTIVAMLAQLFRTLSRRLLSLCRNCIDTGHGLIVRPVIRLS